MEKHQILTIATLMIFMMPIAFARPSFSDKGSESWVGKIGTWSRGVASKFKAWGRPEKTLNDIPPRGNAFGFGNNCSSNAENETGCELNKWNKSADLPASGDLGNKTYQPGLIHKGSGITGTEDFSEFHVVTFRVMRVRQVSTESIKDLIDEGATLETILEYLKNQSVDYWGNMKVGLDTYGFEASFTETEFFGMLYENASVNSFDFGNETAGSFSLTKGTHEETELWRGNITLGNVTYTNTFIFEQPNAQLTGPY